MEERAASPDELDHMPLMARRRFLLAGNACVTAEKRSSKVPSVHRVNFAISQEWPGLPRGTRFDPTDEDLLWHLIAKIGNGTALQHPFIDEFIKSLDLDQGFDMHPQNLCGVKQDGSVSYFFHRPLNKDSNSCQNPIVWRKIGKTKPVFLDGMHQGFKKVYNMFAYRSERGKPKKTNWVLYQYHHTGTDRYEREEELVVSKLFYSLKSKKNASLKHDDASETCVCTDSRESGKVRVEDSNQGQNCNFTYSRESVQSVHTAPTDCVKTEPLSEAGALKVMRSDSSVFNSCIVKSESVEEKVPLKMSESEILETRFPSLGSSSSSQSSEKVTKSRKRKKTATNSVEQALEEDAPGLLKVLTSEGIIMGEIKLYGTGDDDSETLDFSSENDFQNLENVITKLFPERASLLKIITAKHMKVAKAVYCLACLISLIEQTRYLQFRKSPVEWGWCRDLRSFIFVFRTHNRIVLERPEYGYATYFFELVQSVPLDWQILRLITAMKVNSSRACLIENKPLLVGEDLTEGEACVLEEYGWVRNTGIGTMLNYCDRVLHDRYHKSDSSEWRVKIGRLLMNGYNRGSVVLTNVPTKVRKYLSDGGDLSPTSVKIEYQCEL